VSSGPERRWDNLDISWRPLLDLLDAAETRNWDLLACWWGVRWLLTVVPVPEDPPWIAVAYANTPEQREKAYRLASERTVPIVWIPRHGRERITEADAYRPIGWAYGLRPRFNDYNISYWYGVAPDGRPPLGVAGGVRRATPEEDAELQILAVRATLQLAMPDLRIGLEWPDTVRRSLIVFQDDRLRQAVFDQEFLAIADTARNLLSLPKRLGDEPQVVPLAFPPAWRTHIRFGRTDAEARPAKPTAGGKPLRLILREVAEHLALEEARRRGRRRVSPLIALMRDRSQQELNESAVIRYIPPKVIGGYATDNFIGLLWQQLVWAVEARMALARCEGCRGWTMRAPRPGQTKVARPVLCTLCEIALIDDFSGSTRREAYFAWRRRQKRLGASDTTVARYLAEAAKRTRRFKDAPDRG
jgi:hypothetical protein